MKAYGLIGKKLGHSFSKNFFEEKFKREGIEDHSYELFELNNISELSSIIEQREDLRGLNVTIPFKQEVMPYINHLDFAAGKAEAVNTICIKREEAGVQLYGYNTDIIGFKKSLRPFLSPIHDRALILGTGGASKAVAVVLEELDIPYLKVSRDPKEAEIAYGDLNEFILLAHHLIINTTPLGTFPDVGSCPPIPFEYLTENHFLYDLTYNPSESVFLKGGSDKGAMTLNGRSMLEFQAEAAWEIWKNFEKDS